jgi:mycoredoxin-dependent peroxiredoxin
MLIAVGSEAPDFDLPDQHSDRIRLSDFRGRSNLFVVFFPFTFAGICESELCELRDDFPDLEPERAVLLAISCDSQFVQAHWAAEEGLEFHLLSDFWPHGHAARAYGVFNESLGCANRATFLVGKDGRVVT